MKKINKKSLIIFGYSEILLIALLVNSKIVKVKKFHILIDDNEDQFFKEISRFIPHNLDYNNLYYSCGPGGFTIIRKIISFVKALHFNNFSKTKFLGLNNLFVIAFYFNSKYRLKDKEYILSILNYSNDNFFEIFQRKNNSDFFIESFSSIMNNNLDKIESYLNNYNLSFQNINSVYLGSIKNCLTVFKNTLFVDEENILEAIVKISILIENKKLCSNYNKKLFVENFKPLYGKLPSTNGYV